jgi:hypothetical protein
VASTPVIILTCDVPEIAHLEQPERQRILNLCWESQPVQSAWRRYWNRPQQLPLIPIFFVAVYCALTGKGLWTVLLISLPLVFVGFAIVRRHYKKQLVDEIRRSAKTILSQNTAGTALRT